MKTPQVFSWKNSAYYYYYSKTSNNNPITMLAGAAAYCYKENRPCVRWVETYFGDCLCNVRDDLSFGFGVISLVAWGVAEIPQIVTNFRTKSSHGVSILFLLTWIVGDIFNLVGCFLEPATLPTQLYTALLYTVSTVVLVMQSIYYDHLYQRWCKRKSHKLLEDEQKQDVKEPLNVNNKRSRKGVNDAREEGHEGEGIAIPTSAPQRSRREFYYTSARSLAGSNTPPFRSYSLRSAQSGPSSMGLSREYNSSSEDESYNPLPPKPKNPTATQPRPIPRSVAGAAAVVASLDLPYKTNALREAYRGFTGSRRLLQEQSLEHSAFGQWLGWLMAAIYMGGRVPQILLNIKRRSVEGLNPLMFIFALVANTTYVASILVRSTEWDRIKANMPWLLDAVVCVALDLFIMLQYVYYKYLLRMGKDEFDEDDDKKNQQYDYHSIQAE